MPFVHGKPKTSGKRRKPAPTVTYPPGHFTQGCGWLKGWTPMADERKNPGSKIGGRQGCGNAHGVRGNHFDRPGVGD